MSTELYELVALGMRYWFVLLGLVIVWRATRWAWADHRERQRTLNALPYAGLMGEIVNLDNGQSYPLPREGVLGSGKACDVRLPGLKKRELEFVLREGKGVALLPCHRQHLLMLNGEPLGHGEYALHGARLALPGYQLRMRLFANLDIPQPRGYEQEAVQVEEQASEQVTADELDMASLLGYEMADGMPLAPQTDEAQAAQPPWADSLDVTWIHALPPPELLNYQATEGAHEPSVRESRRSRRSRRRGS